jgi:HEAT repeat protein
MRKNLSVSLLLCLLSQSLLLAEAINRDKIVEKLLSEDAKIRQEGRGDVLSIAQKDLSGLEKYLNYKGSWVVRHDAVLALTTIPGTESTKLLLKVIFQDTDTTVISIASHGLKGREKDVTQDELRRLLEMDDQEAIRAALRIVEKIPVDKSILAPLSRALENKRWSIVVRADASFALSKAEGIETDIKIDLILNALKKECENPTPEPNTPSKRMCTSFTDLMKSIYRGGILRMGKLTIPYLKERVKKEEGEFRKNLIITLGYLGDPNVYAEILKIATTDKNPWSRAWAIETLGEIGNKDAIPLLKEALKDPFSVSGGDVKAPPGYEEWNIRYPIRGAAFSSLVKLGVKVESKRPPGTYKVIE